MLHESLRRWMKTRSTRGRTNKKNKGEKSELEQKELALEDEKARKLAKICEKNEK